MNLEAITHIHIKRNDDEQLVDVFLVDERQGEEVRISYRYSELEYPVTLSPSIIYVRNDYVQLLLSTGIVDPVYVESDTGYTNLVLTPNIHRYLKQHSDLFLELIQKEVTRR